MRMNPALHHPVRLVESCNLIDQLNAGRLVVGFGSGFNDTDLIAFGRDLDSAKQVWSKHEGYPGDPAYRDFYRDIGFDVDIGPLFQTPEVA